MIRSGACVQRMSQANSAATARMLGIRKASSSSGRGQRSAVTASRNVFRPPVQTRPPARQPPPVRQAQARVANGRGVGAATERRTVSRAKSVPVASGRGVELPGKSVTKEAARERASSSAWCPPCVDPGPAAETDAQHKKLHPQFVPGCGL